MSGAIGAMFGGTRAGVLPVPHVEARRCVSSDCPDAEDLLSAIAQRRDREAFARLFAQFRPRIKAQLLAARASAATADELAQEVMLLVWRKAGQFDPARGAVATWVYTITRRVWINHLRGRPATQAERDDAAEQLPSGDDLEAAVASAEWGVALAEALAALPGEQRETLRSAYFAERSLREVADATNVPLGTVKTRVRLALERLRGILGKKWDP
jgi:RNA polymerase sigma-70 factor (ECF subfamily)